MNAEIKILITKQRFENTKNKEYPINKMINYYIMLLELNSKSNFTKTNPIISNLYKIFFMNIIINR